MSNPWKKDDFLFDQEQRKFEESLKEKFPGSTTLSEAEQAKVVEFEIGKHCIRALGDFLKGQISQEGMWTILNSRRELAKKQAESQLSH